MIGAYLILAHTTLAATQSSDIASATLEDIVNEAATQEAEIEQMLDDEDRWLLYDLLRDGFAHDKTLGATLPDESGLGPSSPAFAPVLVEEGLRPAWWLAAEHQDRLGRLWGKATPPASMTKADVSFDIPLAQHRLVDTFVDYFTGRGRWFFARWLERAGRYVPMMQPILKEHGLPLDTVYLAMIESGFKASAYSSAAAAGFWQFIRTTGKTYNLHQDTWIDERRDFELATHAAARYLKNLYQEFGDWHLAWAAYNAGEGRIRRALKKTGESTFWGLIEHRHTLAKETMQYVPKIIAAAIVAKNASAYGFDNIESQAPLTFETFTVDSPADMRWLASQLDVPIDDLRALNPALLYDVTPPGRRTKVRVPQGAVESALAAIAAAPPIKRVSYQQHRVARGDTLYRIARRYGTSIAAITELNNIRNPTRLQLGQRLVVPGRHVDTTPSRGKTTVAAQSASQQSPQATHVVSAGETLWAIAQRYGVTVERIKQWNKRRNNMIAIGERLHIF